MYSGQIVVQGRDQSFDNLNIYSPNKQKMIDNISSGRQKLLTSSFTQKNFSPEFKSMNNSNIQQRPQQLQLQLCHH